MVGRWSWPVAWAALVLLLCAVLVQCRLAYRAALLVAIVPLAVPGAAMTAYFVHCPAIHNPRLGCFARLLRVLRS